MEYLWIKEEWIDRTRRAYSGSTEPYETSTGDIGTLFKSLQKRYGRCVSKMYFSKTIDGQLKTIQSGWVFQRKQKYQDCDKYYISETWITVYKSEPKKVVHLECEYAF